MKVSKSQKDFFFTQQNILDNPGSKDERITALDELFERSSRYRITAEYFALLKFIVSLPQLSPFNAFLVHMQ